MNGAKKPSVRKEIIESKLADIIESVNVVSENLPKEPEGFLNLGLAKDGMYKKLEFAIESILDICNIINADLDLGIPEEDEDIINNLQKNNTFSEKTILKIKEMRGFRNILVHKYGKINDEIAFESIKEGINDFELIVEEMREFLRKCS